MKRQTISIFACLLMASAGALAQAQVQPGLWEASTTVNSIDIPGAPPQAAQMMKGQMASGGRNKMTYCITPQQAAQGPQEMLKQNPSCRFSKYVMKAGRIATEMSCTQNGGTIPPAVRCPILTPGPDRVPPRSAQPVRPQKIRTRRGTAFRSGIIHRVRLPCG